MPSMESISPVVSMELFDYPEGGMWDPWAICNCPLETCTCFGDMMSVRTSTPPAEVHPGLPYRAAEQQLAFDPPLVHEENALQFQPPLFTHEAEVYALFADNLASFDNNATTVQPETVQAHVEATYLPGDRLEQVAAMEATAVAAAEVGQANIQALAMQQPQRPRRQRQKRQAPIRNGFPCDMDGCVATFDRQCDLNRHMKKHLANSDRPYKCKYPDCDQRFVYPKDRDRHQTTHPEAAATHRVFYCRAPHCSNVEGFKRDDNRKRHERTQHPELVSGY